MKYSCAREIALEVNITALPLLEKVEVKDLDEYIQVTSKNLQVLKQEQKKVETFLSSYSIDPNTVTIESIKSIIKTEKLEGSEIQVKKIKLEPLDTLINEPCTPTEIKPEIFRVKRENSEDSILDENAKDEKVKLVIKLADLSKSNESLLKSSDSLSKSNDSVQRIGTGSKSLSRIQQTLQEKMPQAKKIANQTPINLFWLYVDAFFKNITEEDMKHLTESEIIEYMDIPHIYNE